MYNEMSVNEHVMMSSDQRSSLCHPDNLLNDQHWTASAIHIEKSKLRSEWSCLPKIFPIYCVTECTWCTKITLLIIRIFLEHQ